MQDIFITLTEALAALDKINKRSVFEEKLNTMKQKAGKLPSAEAQLQCAEEVLKASRYIRKYNGRAHNESAGATLIVESDGGSSYVSETADPFEATDKVIMESLTHPETKRPITEAERRTIKGEKPAGYADLTESQRKEFDFAKMIGISEADCFKLVQITGGYSNEYENKNARR